MGACPVDHRADRIELMEAVLALAQAQAQFQRSLEDLSGRLSLAFLFPHHDGAVDGNDAYEQGQALLARNDLSGAALAFAEAIAAEPSRMAAHIRFITTCQAMGAAFLAWEFYQAVLTAWPAWEEGKIAQGTLFEEMGALKAAQTMLHPDLSRRAAFAGRMRAVGAELGLGDLPFRIVTANVVRSAGFAGYLDAYLKAGRLGLRPDKPVILLAPEEWIAFPALVEKYRALVHVVTDKTAIARLALLRSVVEDRPDWDIEIDGRPVYVEDAMAVIQKKWEDEDRPALFQVTDEEKVRGRRAMAELGLPADAWFVTVHMREPGYWGWAIGDSPRNVDPSTYLTAMAEVTGQGGWVVRIGDPEMTPLPRMERVIDYALSSVRAPWLDLVLIAGSRFLLASNSGPSLFAQIFGVPAILSNWTWDRGPRSGRDLCLPKLWRDKASGRVLTFAETQAPHLSGNDGQKFHDHGIAVEDNGEEDLRMAVVEMLARTGQPPSTPPESDPLQARALSALRHANPSFAMNGRFAQYWLGRTIDLLDPAGEKSR